MAGPAVRPRQGDAEGDVARVMLHRATAVVRSAVIGAAEHPPDGAGPGAAGAAPDRHAQHRQEHRAVLETQLALLDGQFQVLAGESSESSAAARHAGAPALPDATGDAGPPSALWSDIRRTEWAAYGLDAILETYAARAPQAAVVVRQACQALRQWATAARTGL